MNSIQHRFLSDGTCAVQFALYLPYNHPNRYDLSLLNRMISNEIMFRLFQQENLARAASVSDDMMFLNDLDSDLFQRFGIFAAFDSWERAKRFVGFLH